MFAGIDGYMLYIAIVLSLGGAVFCFYQALKIILEIRAEDRRLEREKDGKV